MNSQYSRSWGAVSFLVGAVLISFPVLGSSSVAEAQTFTVKSRLGFVPSSAAKLKDDQMQKACEDHCSPKKGVLENCRQVGSGDSAQVECTCKCVDSTAVTSPAVVR